MQASAIEFELPDPAWIITRRCDVIKADILKQMRGEPQGSHRPATPEGDDLGTVAQGRNGQEQSE
jgi:hypothetical protein